MVQKLSRNATNKSSKHKEVARAEFRLYDDEIKIAERVAEKLDKSTVNETAKYLLINAEKLNLIEKNNLNNLSKEKELRESKLINEVRKIGININQIAFKLNSTGTQSNLFFRDIHQELERIERTLKKIVKKVGE